MDVSGRTIRSQIATAIACVALVASATPAHAQIDFSGQWLGLLHEEIAYRLDEPTLSNGIDGAGGPRIGDYTGLPLNDAARAKADSWDARIMSVPEHQTINGVAAIWVYTGGRMRISNIVDPDTERVIGIRIYRVTVAGNGTSRTIWLDGRPHPSEFAAHTWAGFSTGTWQGQMLNVQTTHVKAGWVRRNGAPASDQATITEHFIRHGNVMTVVGVVTDPVYYDEPVVQSASWVMDSVTPLPDAVPTVIVDEIAGRPDAFVPHHLPGTNTALTELTDKFGIPYPATRGGKATTYPEYRATLQQMLGDKKKTTD